MKRPVLAIALAVSVLSLLFISVSQAELYQYKDKNGVVIITDKKPDKARNVTTFRSPDAKPQERGGQEALKEEKGAKAEGVSPEAAETEKKTAAEAQKEAQRKRDQEAGRLEEEATRPVQFSKEKQIEQREMLERARQLRKGIDPPVKSNGS